MNQKHVQNTQRSTKIEKQAVAPRPQKIDVDEFGPWLMERDRRVLDMLEEYDRRRPIDIRQD